MAGQASCNVFRITPGGVITEIIDWTGDGLGTWLEGPEGVAVDGAGNVFVNDYEGDRLFRIATGGAITEILEDLVDHLDGPMGIVADIQGNVYTSCYHSYNAFRIAPNGVVTELIDTSGDGQGHFLTQCRQIDLDQYGNVYVTGQNTHNAFRIDPTGPGEAICAGDGSAGPCQCANEVLAGTGEGCSNSTGLGATLVSTGSAVVANDDLVLRVAQAPPNAPGVFLQGGSLVQLPFMDGIRCIGNPLFRLGVVQLDDDGRGDSSDFSVVAQGAVTAGQKLYYQFWFRDGGGASVCGFHSNLSSGLSVDWR